MHDVHGAVETLARRTALPDLALDGDGHAELVFGGATPVGLVAIDRFNLELVSPLKEVSGALDRDGLIRLMTANYLGAATGPARLALDPGRNEIVLCGRIDVRGLDEDGLMDRLGGFLAAVAFWKSADGREVLAGRGDADAGQSLNLGLPDGLLIRG